MAFAKTYIPRAYLANTSQPTTKIPTVTFLPPITTNYCCKHNNDNKQKQEKCGCLPTENLGIVVTSTMVQVSQKNNKVLQGRLLLRLGRILVRICKPETCFAVLIGMAVLALFATEQLSQQAVVSMMIFLPWRGKHPKHRWIWTKF
jgi:hypothetical protein